MERDRGDDRRDKQNLPIAPTKNRVVFIDQIKVKFHSIKHASLDHCELNYHFRLYHHTRLYHYNGL